MSSIVVARRLAEEFTSPGLQQKLIDYAADCVQPSYDYFEKKFWTDFLPIVNAFKAARLFNPEKVTDLNPNGTTVEELKVFPFLEDVIPNLKAELAQYLGLADGVAKSIYSIGGSKTKKNYQAGQQHIRK